MDLDQVIKLLKRFQGASLKQSLASIEVAAIGLDVEGARALCRARGVDNDLLQAAMSLKRVAGQINVIIHAAGILRSLGSLLEPGEIIESASLGAGNTGRRFDLETNRRVAEYKFIDWKGGPEAIRQNGIFKDFYSLAEYETHKSKHLYLLGIRVPLQFFTGRRALRSVLGHNPEVLAEIRAKYGSDVRVVRDYYGLKKEEVEIRDVAPILGGSAGMTPDHGCAERELAPDGASRRR